MKKVKRIIILFLSIIGCMTMASCKETNITNPVFEEGDYRFTLISKSKTYTIVGLTEEGKTKETLVLPTTLKGKRITEVGYLGGDLITGTRPTVDFEGATFKNFYVHSLIKICYSEAGHKILASVPPANFYYPSFLEPKATGLLCYLDSDVGYVPNKARMNAIEENPHDLTAQRYISANVIYYMNDDTEDVFFVDDCDGTKVNVIPPDPYRDGYSFKGWYKEKECINSFDFENELIPNKEYDEENNYLLKENNIYAKWEALK